jgi:hypothetical protein
MNALVTGTVPDGTYSGVVFSLSVPEELNHEDPAKLPDPLQAGGMTWSWLFGYKFVRAELISTAKVSGDKLPGGGLFHLGSTGCDNTPDGAEGGAGGEGGAAGPDAGAPPTVACSKPNRPEIRLDDFSPEDDVIVADIGAMMETSDLSIASSCHSGEASCAPYFSSVGLDFSTGDVLDDQTVFRVESK